MYVGFRCWKVALPHIDDEDWKRLKRLQWAKLGQESDGDWANAQKLAGRTKELWPYEEAVLRPLWHNRKDAWADPFDAEAQCGVTACGTQTPSPPNPPGSPPHDDPHNCGFWALNTPERMMAQRNSVRTIGGAVLAGGKMKIAPHGMRAQYMCLLAILDEPEHPIYRTDLIARALDVPALPYSELEEFACEHGETIPYIEPEP